MKAAIYRCLGVVLSVFCHATRSFGDLEGTTILSQNPLAFYQLNETNNPSSGTVMAADAAGARSGTYGTGCQNGYSNISGPRPGAFSGFATNNMAVFTSPGTAGSFVTCPAWNLNTNTVTILAWINPVAAVPWAGIVFSRAGTTVSGLSLNATTSAGNPELAYNWANDANNWGWHAGLYAPLNQWSLAALVVTPTNATIYLSTPGGTASATHTYAHPVQSFDGVTLIGQDSLSNPGRSFNGSIDEVAVFNYALSPTQLQAIYTAATPPAATIDSTKLYQTIEGLGGATAFYAGWITAHPYKQEIYTNAFAGLGLSMLRLGDWFRYPSSIVGFDSAATELVANANSSYLGTSSNVVAQATPASPQYQGYVTTTNVSPVRLPGSSYFWRVDEITGINTNAGTVWSFATLAPQPLRSPWQSQTIGSVGAAGSASFNNGVFVLAGSGADIWGTADAFRYVFVPVTGDATIVARVTSVQNIDPWSKAGLMIRENLSASAINAGIAVTPGNGVTWQYRPTNGGSTSYNNTTGPNAPYWVKLVRSGAVFTGYSSSDGVTWIQLGAATVTMASSAYIGLALTSHNNASLCTATFDNVTAPGWPTSDPPLSPGGLAASSGNAWVALSWTAAGGALSYNLKRATVSAGPYTTVANVATTAYTDTSVLNGANYYYVVSALNLAGESANSAAVAAKPQARPWLSLSPAGTGLVLSWPASATGFALVMRTNLTLGAWLPVTSPPPQVVGSQWQVTVPLSGDARFFRLQY